MGDSACNRSNKFMKNSYFTWEDEKLDFGGAGHQVSQGQPREGCLVTKARGWGGKEEPQYVRSRQEMRTP